MKANDFGRFSKDIVERGREVPSLAVNIWNSTPQPDRGGRTAYELTTEMWDKRTGQAP